MSRVTFSTRDGSDAELRGSERAYAGGLCSDLFCAIVIPNFGSDSHGIWSLIRPIGHYSTRDRDPRALETTFRVGEAKVLIDGHEMDPFDLGLNTALVVGNDQLKLMAYIHGQCEMHGWVDGPDRAWLAGIIREGRKTGMYRPNAGWEDVVDLLESSDQGEVVTQYSVTDSFPSPYVAREAGLWKPFDHHTPEHMKWSEDGNTRLPIEDPEEENCGDCYDSWYEMPREEQWDLAMTGLRKKRKSPQWSPDVFESQWFATPTRNYNAFDVLRASAEVHENVTNSGYGRIYTEGLSQQR